MEMYRIVFKHFKTDEKRQNIKECEEPLSLTCLYDDSSPRDVFVEEMFERMKIEILRKLWEKYS